MIITCENSALEKWLRKKNMTTTHFVEMVGCSRPVVWKVKRGIPISPKYANRIIEITKGEIKPLTENVGRTSVMSRLVK
jgi:hypothetical protein